MRFLFYSIVTLACYISNFLPKITKAKHLISQSDAENFDENLSQLEDYQLETDKAFYDSDKSNQLLIQTGTQSGDYYKDFETTCKELWIIMGA